MKSKRRKRRKHLSFLSSLDKWLIEVILGIVILIISIQMTAEGIIYEKAFDKTKGVVESEKYTGTYSFTRPGAKYPTVCRFYIYSVRYKVGGKEYCSDKYSNTHSNLKKNDNITVWYRRDDPSELINYKDETKGMGFLGILGSIGFIWLGMHDRKR